MTETFKRRRWGWICSSDGYEIRIMGRNDLTYRDAHGDLTIFVEPMSKPRSNIVVQTDKIASTTERSRDEVIDRIRRAFKFAGWNMIEPYAEGESPWL